MELTGEAIFAEVLETYQLDSSTRDYTKPFVITKSIDHIHVNLFEPTEIKYDHTLGGEVQFRMETAYPNSGKIKFHFGMTERRYIEVYIRIPEWAEGTTVTVKKVKYFASPGSYCKIAKKWKEGDVVEVEIPEKLNPSLGSFAAL